MTAIFQSIMSYNYFQKMTPLFTEYETNKALLFFSSGLLLFENICRLSKGGDFYAFWQTCLVCHGGYVLTDSQPAIPASLSWETVINKTTYSSEN